MSGFLLVPTCMFGNYSSITASESIGIVYNAMNSPKSDYAAVDAATNMDFTHSAALSFPTSFASNPAAFWLKLGDGILDGADPNNHYFQLWTGATAGTVAQKTLAAVYGDCAVNGNDVEVNTAIAKTNGFAHLIGVFDDQYSSVVWRIAENYYGTGGGVTSFYLYEVIVGFKVSLPSGFLREDRSIQRVHYGGRVGTKKFGDSNWSGIYSYSPRKSFELTLENTSSTNRDIFLDVFKYSRGVFPILVVEDQSDKTTWTKCKMVRYQEEEDAEMFTVTMEFDEI